MIVSPATEVQLDVRVLERISDGYALLDEEARIVAVIQAAERLLGP